MLLLDQYGIPIPEDYKTPPQAGQAVVMQPSDRYDNDASRGLTPVEVDRIMTAANSGDIAAQCKLALELEEKDWDIFHALDIRRRAVTGIPWSIEPGGDSSADKAAAEAFEAALDAIDAATGLDTFGSLSEDLMTALVPGFAVSEIVWNKGGGFNGFNFVEQRHFTATPEMAAESWTPSALRLVTRNNPNGAPLPPNKFIVHRYRRRGGDVARGGLIRPLAWLYCFKNLGVKDLEAFVERFGMPFVVAQVDKNTWENERNVIKRLIRAFGPAGGGVFSKAVEVKLVQAASTGGDVYFKLLQYYRDAILCVVIGQTATSSEGSGLGNNNAQSQVRQDILEADCALLDATQTEQLARPWTQFNFSPGVKTPKIVRHCEPPEDKKALADMVKTLGEAGLEADAEEISEKVGIKLTRKAVAAEQNLSGTAPQPNGPQVRHPAVARSDEAGTAKPAAIALGADPDSNADATDNLVAAAMERAIASGDAAAWLSPLVERLAAIALSDSADLSGLDKLEFGPADQIAKTVSETAFAASAGAVAQAAANLRRNSGETYPRGGKA